MYPLILPYTDGKHCWLTPCSFYSIIKIRKSVLRIGETTRKDDAEISRFRLSERTIEKLTNAQTLRYSLSDDATLTEKSRSYDTIPE